MINEPYELIKSPPIDNKSPQNLETSFTNKEPISPSFNRSFNSNPQNSLPPFPKAKSENKIELKIQSFQTNGENPDYVRQLSTKIRKQAEQLMALENYKILSEQRISELCPGHPLPVTSNHLGSILGTLFFNYSNTFCRG